MSESGHDSTSENVDASLQRWIAEFAPLVTDKTPLKVVEVRERIRLIGSLRESGQLIRTQLEGLHNNVSEEAHATFVSAFDQLDSITQDLRKYLGKLSPGDPDSITDLQEVQESLESRSARIEAGLPTLQERPQFIRLQFQHSDLFSSGMPFVIFFLGSAICTGLVFIFVFLVLSPSTKLSDVPLFALMIPVGFFGLLRYILAGLSHEILEIQGAELTLRKKLGPVQTEEKFQLSKCAEATMLTEDRQRTLFTNQIAYSLDPIVTRIMLKAGDGRIVKFGAGADPIQRKDALDRINAYLKANR